MRDCNKGSKSSRAKLSAAKKIKITAPILMHGVYSFVNPRLVRPDRVLYWPLLYKRAELDLRVTKDFLSIRPFSLFLTTVMILIMD